MHADSVNGSPERSVGATEWPTIASFLIRLHQVKYRQPNNAQQHCIRVQPICTFYLLGNQDNKQAARLCGPLQPVQSYSSRMPKSVNKHPCKIMDPALAITRISRNRDLCPFLALSLAEVYRPTSAAHGGAPAKYLDSHMVSWTVVGEL